MTLSKTRTKELLELLDQLTVFFMEQDLDADDLYQIAYDLEKHLEEIEDEH